MNSTTSCLGSTQAEAFHGVFTSVAAPKPYFPPKPCPSFFFQRSSQKPNLSFSHNANTSKSIGSNRPYPSFFFQRSSQKPHLSFSHNAKTSKSIGMIRDWDYGGPLSTGKGRLHPEGLSLSLSKDFSYDDSNLSQLLC